LFLASLFANLPAATLGAVVIDAMLGVVTFGPMRRYFEVNRADGSSSWAPCSASCSSGSSGGS
jgi:hypothetical protein